MKRCLVISDSFKGTLSSPDICRIARSISLPGWHIDALPVADGGEGTTDCFLDACGGQKRSVAVTDPFGDPLTACYGLLPDGTAVIECAAAAGLPQAEGRLDPERTTTYGVGQLLAHALDHGAQRLILGLGGSCTNDGGCGAAAALGALFYDRQGRSFVPTGITLSQLSAIDLRGLHPALHTTPLTVMCDIRNPLYGPDGAACVFAPQKGADNACVSRLDAGLRHLARVIAVSLHTDVSALPGGGAAGGFGAGCAAFLGGTLRSGIETVLDVIQLNRRLPDYQLVVTGEGRLDAQSLDGKVVSGVARRCRAHGVPVAALVGALSLDRAALEALGLSAARSINPDGASYAEAAAHAAPNYRAALTALLEEY